jgi:hypothetical protein
MFVIQRNLFDHVINLTDYSCRDESGLKKLEIDCQNLNNNEEDFIKYSIIELKDQFLCECCNTIYYNIYRNIHDCDCGAIRCKFCEKLNDCTCCDNEDDDLELQDLEKEDF